MCDAKFTAETPVRYSVPPAVGDVRRCMLLVRDETVVVADVLKGLGWETLGVASREIAAEEFDKPEMQPFRRHYEACLKDGHAFVWYS